MPWIFVDEHRDDTGIERTYRNQDAAGRGGQQVIFSVVFWPEGGYEVNIIFQWPDTDLGDQTAQLPQPLGVLLWQLLCQVEKVRGEHGVREPKDWPFHPDSVRGSTLLGAVAEVTSNFVRRDDIVTMRQLVREYDQEQDRLFLEREAENGESE